MEQARKINITIGGAELGEEGGDHATISADCTRRAERHRLVGMLIKRLGSKERIQQVVLCGNSGQNAGSGAAFRTASSRRGFVGSVARMLDWGRQQGTAA